MPTREEVLAALTRQGPFELVVDGSAGFPQRVYRNAPPSFREVFISTRAHRERAFAVYGGETLTYAQHYRQAAALARRLLEAGVRKGDRVAVGMRNYPEWSVAFWACQAIGAIVVALNAWWTSG
ncbi:MAG TPA: AMP-binding protein, partial [Caulobacteraceae bacterium]|nr:AMP-binding protein [Caulobacteraceae bacterium]